MAAIDIGVKFSLEKLDEIVGGFNKLIEGVDFGKGFELDAQTIKAQFGIVKDQLAKALQTGELDVKSLNLPGLVRSLESVAKQAAKAMGSELNDKALEPFKAELDTIGGEIDKKANQLKDITSQRKGLTEEAVKKQTREETGGGVSRVMFGSMSEAEGYLKKLKEAEKEDPGASAKRTELIDFYKAYVKNLKQAEKARLDLNKEEDKIKGEITKLKAKEEALILKIKKESAAIDAQTPANIQNILALSTQLREVYEKLRKTQKAGNDEKKKEIEGTKESTNANNAEAKSFASKAISAGLYYTAINQVKRLMRESVQVVKELDKAMTDAAIVTDMNRKEAWKLLGTYQNLAKETGLAVGEISGVVVEFLKQGRTTKEALELAEVAAKAAKVAGISANDAVDYLTSAVNGFGLAADKAIDIADKFSAIAAASATDFNELAIAMSKVAPVAKVAGVGVDFMMGVLAKGLETTREAPENIGTAFKTIFARMREVTDIGKATEDGMSLNRVEKALDSIDVPLRNVSGQFRNLEDVLIDVGDKWDTLTSIEQAYIATSLAGTRQQPRLLAIFNDFARTKELIELSSESVGALQFQHIDYMEGMEAAMNQLQNSWQGFIMALTESDIIIGIINVMTFAIETLAGAFKLLNTPAGHTVAILGLIGIALTTMLAKTMANTAATIKEALATVVLSLVNKKADKTYRGLSNMKFSTMVKTFGLTAANVGETASAKAATFANSNLALSFKILAASIWATLLPLLPFIAAALAIVAIGALIGLALYEASKDAAYFAEELDKTGKKLNDLEGKEKNIKKLTDRFKELQRVTNKTAADIEEMSRIAEELNTAELSVDGKTQTYNFAEVDFTGASVFNEEEYQRFLDDAALERERLNAEASKAFASAIRTDGVLAFEEKSVSDFARKQGYEAGVAFADNLAQGFDDETKSKVKKQLADSLKQMDMSIFYRIRYRTSDGKEFDTAAERDAYVANQRAAGNKISALTRYDTMAFDEEGLEEFSEKLTQIYADGTQELQDRINEIMDPKKGLSIAEQTRQVLNATVEEYQEQIEDARAQFEGEELKAALAVIAQSNTDAVILDGLLGKGIEMDVIVNLQLQGQNMSQIDEFISQYADQTFTGGGASGFRNQAERDAFFAQQDQINEDRADVRESIALAASGGAENITAGFTSFRENLAAMGYTPEQIKEAVNELAGVIKTLSIEQVGALMKSQSDLTKNAMGLSEQIAKGDFSNFGEIVTEYGLEAATDILNGSEAGIRAVMEKNARETRAEIAASIALIYEREGVTDFANLSDAAKEQVTSLELMSSYYEDIVGFETLREFRMKQVTGYMKEMNDLMKLQQSLLDLGAAEDSPFVNTLNEMVDSLDRLARIKIDKQLEADLANLEQFGTFVDGVFVINPDINITQANQAIDAAMSTLTTYVQMQTEAFNKQKKAIDDAAKSEIDAAKTSFNERWAALEYTNKLVEAEEKIFEVRRRVAALSISGASAGQFAETQKDLKKLEEERRKMIEQQGLEEVQKELEAQRDEAIAVAQQTMTAAIEEYTAQLVEVLPGLTVALENLIIALDDNTEITQEDVDAAHKGIKIGPGKMGVEFLGPMM
jgi:TP901 family phage tail tape measure protein